MRTFPWFIVLVFVFYLFFLPFIIFYKLFISFFLLRFVFFAFFLRRENWSMAPAIYLLDIRRYKYDINAAYSQLIRNHEPVYESSVNITATFMLQLREIVEPFGEMVLIRACFVWSWIVRILCMTNRSILFNTNWRWRMTEKMQKSVEINLESIVQSVF